MKISGTHRKALAENGQSPVKEAPIGVFDSGLGGLTVMREVLRYLPHEHVIYLGDTARLPYGNKSPGTVLRYTLDNVSFFLEQKIKFLIVACFTASSHALRELEQRLQIPVIGVIKYGLNELLASTKLKRVALLATASTIKSGILQSLIHKHDPSIAVFPAPCSLFVPFIEEGLSDHSALRSVAHHYLDRLKDIDAALLACTHYPLIQPMIQEVLGNHVQLISPAESCAIAAKNFLSSLDLLNLQKSKPSHRFYVTDDPEKFRLLTASFFGSEIDEVTLLNH